MLAKHTTSIFSFSCHWVTYRLIVRQLQPGLVLHGPFAQIDGCDRQQRERETDREERNRQEAMRDLALSTLMYNPTPTNTHIQHKTLIGFCAFYCIYHLCLASLQTVGTVNESPLTISEHLPTVNSYSYTYRDALQFSLTVQQSCNSPGKADCGLNTGCSVL